MLEIKEEKLAKEIKKVTRRSLKGRVVSCKMTKTVTVLVVRRVKHPILEKVTNDSKKYHAHVDGVACSEGDLVLIQECRPISKT